MRRVCDLHRFIPFLLILVGFESRSFADASPNFNMINWYVPVGVNLGAAVHPENHEGFVLGGETGAIRFFRENPIMHVGAFLDYSYDWGSESHRWSLGPEFGVSVFRLDIGLMLRDEHTKLQGDVRFRASLYLFFAAIYVAETVNWFAGSERAYTEMGVVLQVPFCIESHGPCDHGFSPNKNGRGR